MMADKPVEPTSENSIVIGTGVEIKGDMIVPGSATVDGKFEGKCKAKNLIVGPTGCLSGQISVETAEVRGTIEENLTVESKLTLRSSGNISGSIGYSKIMVEEGGILTGTIEKIASQQAKAAPENAEPNVVQLTRTAE